MLSPVIFKSTPHTRNFGVELEVSATLSKQELGLLLEDFELFYGTARLVKVTPGMKGWADTHANDYWHVKYDSTCGPKGKPDDYGWEVASFIGRSDFDLENISRAAVWLADHDVTTNQNCGLHIHVDVADFSPWQMGVLIARWLKIEFCVMAACHNRRLNSPYCQLLNLRRITQPAIYYRDDPTNFWKDMAPENLGVHDNYDKRYTVNTIGYRIGEARPGYSRQTVEFRFPECVLSESHISNWVRFLLCFVTECYEAKTAPENIAKAESVAEALQLVGLQGDPCFYLLDEKLLNTKMWFLQSIIHHSKNTTYAADARDLLAFIGSI